MLNMALDPIRGSRKDYWSTTDIHNMKTVFTAKNYGARFGMSRDRFESIVRYMKWSKPYTPEQLRQVINDKVLSSVDKLVLCFMLCSP